MSFSSSASGPTGPPAPADPTLDSDSAPTPTPPDDGAEFGFPDAGESALEATNDAESVLADIESDAGQLLSTAFPDGLSDQFSSAQNGWITASPAGDPYTGLAAAVGSLYAFVGQVVDFYTGVAPVSANPNGYTGGENVNPSTGLQSAMPFADPTATSQGPAQNSGPTDLLTAFQNYQSLMASFSGGGALDTSQMQAAKDPVTATSTSNPTLDSNLGKIVDNMRSDVLSDAGYIYSTGGGVNNTYSNGATPVVTEIPLPSVSAPTALSATIVAETNPGPPAAAQTSQAPADTSPTQSSSPQPLVGLATLSSFLAGTDWISSFFTTQDSTPPPSAPPTTFSPSDSSASPGWQPIEAPDGSLFRLYPETPVGIGAGSLMTQQADWFDRATHSPGIMGGGLFSNPSSPSPLSFPSSPGSPLRLPGFGPESFRYPFVEPTTPAPAKLPSGPGLPVSEPPPATGFLDEVLGVLGEVAGGAAVILTAGILIPGDTTLKPPKPYTVKELQGMGWHFHHWFPQSKALAERFADLGIDVHQYTTLLPPEFHVQDLHGEAQWNKVWEEWLDWAEDESLKEDDAPEEAVAYLYQLLQPYLRQMEDAGILGPNGLNAIVPYPRR